MYTLQLSVDRDCSWCRDTFVWLRRTNTFTIFSQCRHNIWFVFVFVMIIQSTHIHTHTCIEVFSESLFLSRTQFFYFFYNQTSSRRVWVECKVFNIFSFLFNFCTISECVSLLYLAYSYKYMSWEGDGERRNIVRKKNTKKNEVREKKILFLCNRDVSVKCEWKGKVRVGNSVVVAKIVWHFGDCKDFKNTS